jgi:hypothetical protein
VDDLEPVYRAAERRDAFDPQSDENMRGRLFVPD